jgi:Flp pilus assembly protein TadG
MTTPAKTTMRMRRMSRWVGTSTAGVARRWRRLTDRGREDGSGGMSLLLLIAAFALLVVVGLVVDGGAKAAGLDKATRLAAEAARSALQAANLATGNIPDTVAATEVDRYLTTAGATSWTTTLDGTAVIVTVTLTRPTKLLPLMGVNSWTVTATGRADGLYGLYPR